MIVRRFLLWARTAPPGHRAEAIASLAKTYLYSDLSPEDRSEAETALTAMLDDPSPAVRLAMAESLARSPDAPRPVILALAWDQTEIAEIVLARSPVLIDADLVDAAALGGVRVQVAIASRPWVSAGVAAALAEIGSADVILALARNLDAEITPATVRAMVHRHADYACLRDALLARPDLPVDVAQSIAAAVASALEAFVSGCGWLSPKRSERVAREACDQAALLLSARSDPSGVTGLVEHLRRSAQLTPGLLLRALLSGQKRFVEAAFRELTGLSASRVAAILRDPSRRAFAALYDKAGLPGLLRPAFERCLSALSGNADGFEESAGLSRRLVASAIAGCRDLPQAESERLVAVLRRFDMEAAREEARRMASTLADDAALDLMLRYAPEQLAAPGPDRTAMAA